MIIYNVICKDKSSGIHVDSYADRELAIQAARDFLDSVAPGDWEEWKGNRNAFIFFAYYGESDISVVSTHLNYRPEVA